MDTPIDTIYTAAKWMLDRERLAPALDLFRAMLLIAPADERGWLGLAHCHERRGEHGIALELYALGAGTASSARCHIGRSRLFRKLGRDDDAETALEAAADAAAADDDLVSLVEQERRAA